MNRQEIKVAIFALLIIGAGAAAIQYGKPRLGNPGLAMEPGTLTNELGAVVRTNRIAIPARVPGFVSADAPIAKWEHSHLPEDTSFGRKLYFDPAAGFSAQLSAVMMKTDRTSIHRPQICIHAQGWTVHKAETIDIQMASPEPYKLGATCLTLSKEIQQNGKARRLAGLYVYWFVAEHRLAPTHPEAIWYITQDLITSGTLHPWAFISCYAEFEPGQEAAQLLRIKRLIAGAAPEFQLMPGGGTKTALLDSSAKTN